MADPTDPAWRRGRALLAVAIVLTVVITMIADVLNTTHLFNPDWPPHARFHNAMQFLALMIVSGFALWVLYGPRRTDGLAPMIGLVAVIHFWIPLYLAVPIPGVSLYATPEMATRGIPVNLIVAAAVSLLAGYGYRRMTRAASRSATTGATRSSPQVDPA